MAEIQKVLVQKMENKEKKKQEKERQMLTEREQLTNQINEYSGLWSKEVVWKNIDELRSKADKQLALKIPLNFGAKVLETKCNRSLFLLSSGGKMKAVNDLLDNLIKVMDFTEKVCNSSVDDSVFPHVLSKSNLDKQKDIILGKNNPPPTKDSFSSRTKKRRVNKKKEHVPSKEKKPTKFFPS